MTFRELSTYFERIEKVSSRLEMTDILAKLYGECSSEEVAIVSYLFVGRVVPMFIPVEFNVADKTVLRVLEGMLLGGGGRSSRGRKFDVKKAYGRIGDLGEVVAEMYEKGYGRERNKRTRSVSLEVLYERLWEIAMVSGTGSMDVRNKKIFTLLDSMSPIEAKYAVRILLQRMRLGSSDKTVLDALSVMKKGDKQDRDEIERAYGVCSDLGYVSSRYVKGGVRSLNRIKVTPGVPVSPMLVEREKDLESVHKRIPDAIVQHKFDGIRCQVHVGVGDDEKLSDRIWWKNWQEFSATESGTLFDTSGQLTRVRLYSRNLEDITKMFPEVIAGVERLKIKSGVFDAEVIGYSEETGEFRPFQETMTRKRKYNINDASQKVPVRLFIFDVLSLNGRSLLDKKNEKRIAIVEKIFPGEGVVVASESWRATSVEELEGYFNEAIADGLEGAVVKEPSSQYKPGKRGFDWIKLKRAFQGQLADTVDVVILGYYFGRGRQADFGIGALLGGVYDAKNDAFVSLAKIGTGVTDEQWKIIKKDLDEIKSADIPKRVELEKSLYPDQWVEPKIVATVEADEITKSPIHTAGRDKDGVGYALRFPRLKEWKRDKQPEDSTSVKEVMDMYGKQG